MPALARPFEAEPMMEMNTTPLIDVLLVLIVMLIITVPLQTHAVKLDLPSDGNTTVNPIRNQLAITAAGGLLWNGQPVTRAELQDRLIATTQLPETPELHVRPDANAPYARVDEVLVMTKRAKVERLGFVGNEVYARF